jgi:hypothetical protein
MHSRAWSRRAGALEAVEFGVHFESGLKIDVIIPDDSEFNRSRLHEAFAFLL